MSDISSVSHPSYYHPPPLSSSVVPSGAPPSSLAPASVFPSSSSSSTSYSGSSPTGRRQLPARSSRSVVPGEDPYEQQLIMQHVQAEQKKAARREKKESNQISKLTSAAEAEGILAEHVEPEGFQEQQQQINTTEENRDAQQQQRARDNPHESNPLSGISNSNANNEKDELKSEGIKHGGQESEKEENGATENVKGVSDGQFEHHFHNNTSNKTNGNIDNTSTPPHNSDAVTLPPPSSSLSTAYSSSSPPSLNTGQSDSYSSSSSNSPSVPILPLVFPAPLPDHSVSSSSSTTPTTPSALLKRKRGRPSKADLLARGLLPPGTQLDSKKRKSLSDEEEKILALKRAEKKGLKVLKGEVKGGASREQKENAVKAVMGRLTLEDPVILTAVMRELILSIDRFEGVSSFMNDVAEVARHRIEELRQVLTQAQPPPPPPSATTTTTSVETSTTLPASSSSSSSAPLAPSSPLAAPVTHSALPSPAVPESVLHETEIKEENLSVEDQDMIGIMNGS